MITWGNNHAIIHCVPISSQFRLKAIHTHTHTHHIHTHKPHIHIHHTYRPHTHKHIHTHTHTPHIHTDHTHIHHIHTHHTHTHTHGIYTHKHTHTNHTHTQSVWIQTPPTQLIKDKGVCLRPLADLVGLTTDKDRDVVGLGEGGQHGGANARHDVGIVEHSMGPQQQSRLLPPTTAWLTHLKVKQDTGSQMEHLPHAFNPTPVCFMSSVQKQCVSHHQ